MREMRKRPAASGLANDGILNTMQGRMDVVTVKHRRGQLQVGAGPPEINDEHAGDVERQLRAVILRDEM